MCRSVQLFKCPKVLCVLSLCARSAELKLLGAAAAELCLGLNQISLLPQLQLRPEYSGFLVLTSRTTAYSCLSLF